jgi:hypothetical protein
MSVELLEGGRFDPPPIGEPRVAEVEHEGYKAVLEAEVTRASAHAVGLNLRRRASHDDELDAGLLGLLTQLAARRMVHLTRRPGTGRAGGEHFVGPGRLDLRVSASPPGFWQLVFLEYVVGWSEEDGLQTATTRGRVAVDADALSPGPQTTPHERPWRSLSKLAVHLSVHAAAMHPRHADLFALIQRSARMEK